MAWTWPTIFIFVAIFSSIALLTIIEIKSPGGADRRGTLGLVTTRGDRLFLGILGSVYIFLAWLGFVGQPLWIPLGLAIIWFIYCFRKI